MHYKTHRLNRYIAATIILLGLFLLTYMITVEGEPGAIPLIVLLASTVWFFKNERTMRKHKLHEPKPKTMKNKRFIIIITSVITLLLIPFIAMQFTNEVNWDAFDFIVMGMLLLSTALVCEFILRRVQRFGLRIIALGIALACLFLVWAELAVGIFGSPFAGS